MLNIVFHNTQFCCSRKPASGNIQMNECDYLIKSMKNMWWAEISSMDIVYTLLY